MKKKFLLALSLSMLLSGCNGGVSKPDSVSSAGSASKTPSVEKPSVKSDSTSSSSSVSSNTGSVTPAIEARKIGEDSAQGVVDYLTALGRSHNYRLLMQIRNDTESYLYDYTENYMVNENTHSGVVLLDSYSKETTGGDKVLYSFEEDDLTGNLVLKGAVMNTSKNVPYMDPKSYDALSGLTLSNGDYNKSSYPVEKIKKKGNGYQVNDVSFISLFASLCSATSVKKYITRFTIDLDEDMEGLTLTCYAKSTGEEFALLTCHVFDGDVALSEDLDVDLTEMKLPEEKLDSSKLSGYVQSTYAFESEFSLIDDKGNSTVSSSVDVSFDGDDFYAVVYGQNQDPTGYYHYLDKNNETYYSYINGNNELEESLVTQDGKAYAFDEYILSPSVYLDTEQVREVKDGTYRYLGVHADDIFLALTFNNPSNFGYVDYMDVSLKDDGSVSSLDFYFTGLSDNDGNAVTLVCSSKAVSAPEDTKFKPFDNSNPLLQSAMDSLKTTSFSIKGVGDIDSSLGKLTQRRRADYIYDAAEKRLLVEQYTFDSDTYQNVLESRRGYRMDGNVLYFYNLSTKDREDGKYDILSSGYTDDASIEAYFPIIGSSKVFRKSADNVYESELFCNPTDYLYFGEVLTNYYPNVEIVLENGRIKEMSADYVLSSSYSMTCKDKMTFSYENVTLGEFVE